MRGMERAVRSPCRGAATRRRGPTAIGETADPRDPWSEEEECTMWERCYKDKG